MSAARAAARTGGRAWAVSPTSSRAIAGRSAGGISATAPGRARSSQLGHQRVDRRLPGVRPQPGDRAGHGRFFGGRHGDVGSLRRHGRPPQPRADPGQGEQDRPGRDERQRPPGGRVRRPARADEDRHDPDPRDGHEPGRVRGDRDRPQAEPGHGQHRPPGRRQQHSGGGRRDRPHLRTQGRRESARHVGSGPARPPAVRRRRPVGPRRTVRPGRPIADRRPIGRRQPRRRRQGWGRNGLRRLGHRGRVGSSLDRGRRDRGRHVDGRLGRLVDGRLGRLVGGQRGGRRGRPFGRVALGQNYGFGVVDTDRVEFADQVAEVHRRGVGDPDRPDAERAEGRCAGLVVRGE